MTHPYFEKLSTDPLLVKIFGNVQPYELKLNTNVPLALYTSIINQQLSTKVANVIYGRFLGLFGGVEPTPQQIIDIPIEQLQSVGLSKSKAGYIKNVAQFDIDNGLGTEKLNQMTEEEIYKYVGSIKGIGQWTVHILLMFSLQREDVFIADDLGIQNAMAALFNLDKTNRKKLREDIIKLSEQWRPYRTFLCVHLWRWINLQQTIKSEKSKQSV